MHRSVFMAVSTLIGALAAHAQTPQPALDLHSAAVIRDACLSHAEDNGQTVAVAVFDQGGNLVTFARLDGTSLAAQDISQWKGRSAAMYRRSTLETREWNAPEAPGIATFQGGLAIFSQEGAPLGGVGVSGAPSAFDEACAAVGLEAAGLLSAPPEAETPDD